MPLLSLEQQFRQRIFEWLRPIRKAKGFRSFDERSMDIMSVSHSGPAGPSVRDTQPPNALLDNRELIHAVDGINASQLLGGDSQLTLTIDQQTRLPVIRIISSLTHQVVMQLPAEYVLHLKQALESQPDTYQKSDRTASPEDTAAGCNGY